MLTNLTIYKIAGDLPEFDFLAEAMNAAVFVACPLTQPQSVGWVPPREDSDAMLENIGGHWLATLQIETRLLPSPVVKRRVKEMAEAIEKATGRRPAKKALRDLKDEATLELLPRAFTRIVKVVVWIDPRRRLVVIDTASAKRAEAAGEALIAAFPKLNLHPLRTNSDPGNTMRTWVMDDAAPVDFSLERSVELRGIDENPPVVSLAQCDLDSEEVSGFLESGMLVARLAMTYKGRVSFTLHANGQLRGVEILDVAFESQTQEVDAFDSEVAIRTGELGPLLDALIDSLGGVFVPPIEKAAEGDKPADAPAPFTGEAADDPLYQQAVAVVRAEQRASISLVQRVLRIGYNRAARLLEHMETEGIVTPCDSQGLRSVIAQGAAA